MQIKMLSINILLALLFIAQTSKPEKLVLLDEWITFGFKENKDESYLAFAAFGAIEFEKDTSNKMLLIQISEDKAMNDNIFDTQRDQLSFSKFLFVDLSRDTKGDYVNLRITCLLCHSGAKYVNRFKLLPLTSSTRKANAIAQEEDYITLIEDEEYPIVASDSVSRSVFNFRIAKRAQSSLIIAINNFNRKTLLVQLSNSNGLLFSNQTTNNSFTVITREEEYEENTYYNLAVQAADGQLKDNYLTIVYNNIIKPMELRKNEFESSSPNAVKAQKIDESEPMQDLNSSQLEYGYYYNLSSFGENEDAVLKIVFKSKVDLSETNFKFIAKIESVDIKDWELDKYLPSEDYVSDFKFVQENSQHATMYFKQKLNSVPGMSPIIFFLIKFITLPETATPAEIRKIRTEKITISSNNHMTISLSENFPYFIQFYTTSLHVVYSNTSFNVYPSGLVEGLDTKVLQKHFVSEMGSMVIEMFGPTQTSAILYYNKTDYNFHQVDLENTDEVNNFKYYISKIPIQYVLLTKSPDANSNKWIYFKQELGTPIALTYSQFDEIKFNMPMVFPSQNYTINEAISLRSKFHAIRVVSILNTYFTLGIVEKVDAITIEDKDKESYVHILDKGTHVIDLNPSLKGRNVKVTLIQFASEGNKDISISAGSEIKVINNAKIKSGQFLRIQFDKMTIESPYQYIILEFKLDYFVQLYQEIRGDGKEESASYIYYKIPSEKYDSFKFQFNQPVEGIKCNVGSGDMLAFASKPNYEFPVFGRNYIEILTNPYNINQPLASNEFFYVSFQIPNTISSYTIAVSSDTRDLFIPTGELNEGKSEMTLYSDKDKSKTQLVIVILQCIVQQYEMSLFLLEENRKNIYTLSSKNELEVFTFPNDYLSFNLIFNENKEQKCSLAYNYLNDNEAQPFKDLVTNKDSFVFKYDDETTTISWTNPNDVFSEFRFFIDNENSDFSNECKLMTIDKYTTVKGKTEFVLKDNGFQHEIYKINVLGVSQKNLFFHYAYREKKIYYLNIPPISPTGEPLNIDFAKPLYGCYLKLDDYKNNEEGMIMITFEADLTDQLKSELIFGARLANINIDDDISPSIPDGKSNSQFDYVIEQNKYIKMHIKNKEMSKNSDTRTILAIVLKFLNPQEIKAKIVHVKVFSSAVVVGHYHIYRQFVDIKDHVPFLFKIKKINSSLYKTLLFFSEPAVSLYENSLLNSTDGINGKETLSIKSFNESSSDSYVAEYFGPAGKVYFYFEKLNDTVTLIPSSSITNLFDNHCKRDFIGQSEYFAGSFADIADFNKYHLYIKQDYGLVNSFYTNIIDIKGVERSILPNNSTDAFTGISDLKNPHFILKLECKYPGDGYIQLLKPSDNIILEDSSKNPNEDKSKVHVLTKGEHKIRLKDLTNRNIEVNLIQMKLSANNNIEVRVGSNLSTLSNNSKVLRFFKVAEAELIINSPSDYIVIEFKLDLESLTKVKGDRAEQTAQYMYYQLPIDRSQDFIYEFDRQLAEEITYTLSKGINEFLLKPVKNATINTAQNVSFSIPNPYSTYSELESNEFWYVSVKTPDDITFHELLVKPNDGNVAPLIPSTSLNSLRVSRNSIEMSQDKSKSSLAVFLIQCNRTDSQLKLYYFNTGVYSQKGNSLRELFTVNNDRVPLEIEYDIGGKSTTANEQYYLSYNYMTQADADGIKSTIASVYEITFNGTTTILAWNTPEIPLTKVRLYLIESTSAEKISNECEMMNSNKGIIVQGKEYNLTERKDLANGTYRANILVENEDKLNYAIAYKELQFDYNIQSNNDETSASNSVGLWVGVVVGIIAFIGIVVGVFLWRRNRKKNAVEGNIGQLI